MIVIMYCIMMQFNSDIFGNHLIFISKTLFDNNKHLIMSGNYGYDPSSKQDANTSPQVCIL
mgnify:CR=1 FL=1